ncbi:MAG: L7Ae/L30e/S12e/Gadd45 family ribosomal protein [Christensenellales bacterium]
MSYEKLYALIGLAVKAGKCALGSFACEESLKRKKACLVVIDHSAQNTIDKIRNHCGDVPLIVLQNDRLGSVTGRQGLKVAAILDRGFAGSILENYEGLRFDGGNTDKCPN